VVEGLDELEVVTLFVEDVQACKAFYAAVLGLRNLMINLLTVENAPTLVEPAAVGAPGAGSRALFTIRVDDVDTTAAELERHGVSLLNGPVDRPWGRRTAAFTDPAGNTWEIAQIVG
jgi:catechol 2,3-dioxygenase-like lactoylglutathione lyase family enzyme